jgi:type IV secretory pathway VirB3-like protein
LSTALAHTTNLLTTEEIAKGFRSTLFSIMHGLLVYIIAMILFAVLKLTVKNEPD